MCLVCMYKHTVACLSMHITHIQSINHDLLYCNADGKIIKRLYNNTHWLLLRSHKLILNVAVAEEKWALTYVTCSFRCFRSRYASVYHSIWFPNPSI